MAIPFYLAFGISPSDDWTTEAQPHPVEKPQKKQVQPSYLPHQIKIRQKKQKPYPQLVLSVAIAQHNLLFLDGQTAQALLNRRRKKSWNGDTIPKLYRLEDYKSLSSIRPRLDSFTRICFPLLSKARGH